jgi:PPOX class probable F420-dependent enzyme
MNDKLKQFAGQKYLNIETFRKNGEGVKTPVWFAQDGETLHVWTEAGSGKARRIRNNSAVRIAPSDMGGAPLGEWIPARADANDSPEAIQYVQKLMTKKYGLQFMLFNGLGQIRKSKNVVIKITLQ